MSSKVTKQQISGAWLAPEGFNLEQCKKDVISSLPSGSGAVLNASQKSYAYILAGLALVISLASIVGLVVGLLHSSKEVGCPNGNVPNSDQTICVPCNPSEIVISGLCHACPSQEVPNVFRTECKACLSGEVQNMDRTMCTACPYNEIAKNGICQACPVGAVPAPNQTTCLVCNLDEITNNAICQACPSGNIPNTDQTTCLPCNPNEIVNRTLL